MVDKRSPLANPIIGDLLGVSERMTLSLYDIMNILVPINIHDDMWYHKFIILKKERNGSRHVRDPGNI